MKDDMAQWQEAFALWQKAWDLWEEDQARVRRRRARFRCLVRWSLLALYAANVVAATVGLITGTGFYGLANWATAFLCYRASLLYRESIP